MGKPRHRPVRTELGYGVFSIHDPPTDGIDGTAGPPAESHPEPPVARTELQAPLAILNKLQTLVDHVPALTMPYNLDLEPMGQASDSCMDFDVDAMMSNPLPDYNPHELALLNEQAYRGVNPSQFSLPSVASASEGTCQSRIYPHGAVTYIFSSLEDLKALSQAWGTVVEVAIVIAISDTYYLIGWALKDSDMWNSIANQALIRAKHLHATHRQCQLKRGFFLKDGDLEPEAWITTENSTMMSLVQNGIRDFRKFLKDTAAAYIEPVKQRAWDGLELVKGYGILREEVSGIKATPTIIQQRVQALLEGDAYLSAGYAEECRGDGQSPVVLDVFWDAFYMNRQLIARKVYTVWKKYSPAEAIPWVDIIPPSYSYLMTAAAVRNCLSSRKTGRFKEKHFTEASNLPIFEALRDNAFPQQCKVICNEYGAQWSQQLVTEMMEEFETDSSDSA